MTSRLLIAALVIASGCSLQWDSRMCETHEDCVEGWSCTDHQCVDTYTEVRVVTATVREDRTAIIHGFDGNGGGVEVPAKNIHMDLGTLEQTGPGEFVYTPTPHPDLASDYVDKGSYDIAYASHTPPVTVPVSIKVVKDKAPTVRTDTVTVPLNVTTAFAGAFDAEGDSLTTTITQAPAHGTAIVVAGMITYTPANNYYGEDRIYVSVSDGTATSTGVVSIDVSCGTAVADSVTTTWFDPVSFDPRGNDTITNTTVEILTAPTKGTATVIDGKIQYRAARGFIGSDELTYRAVRPEGCSATAKLSIRVTQPVERLLSPAPPGLFAIDGEGQTIAFINATFHTISIWTPSGVTQPIHGVGGALPNGEFFRPRISGDGRYIVFDSTATNLVSDVSVSGLGDVYLFDRSTGVIELVSRSASGAANYESNDPDVSDDGRIVSFTSVATNLVPGDTNGKRDVFVRDRLMGTTERVNVASDGTQANGLCGTHARITKDGHLVAFVCNASSLGNASGGLYVHDRSARTTTFVQYAVSPPSDAIVLMARGGRYVASDGELFDLAATALVSHNVTQISDDGRFLMEGGSLYDAQTLTNITYCKDIDGLPPSGSFSNGCFYPTLAGAGHTMLFSSLLDLDQSASTNEPCYDDGFGPPCPPAPSQKLFRTHF